MTNMLRPSQRAVLFTLMCVSCLCFTACDSSDETPSKPASTQEENQTSTTASSGSVEDDTAQGVEAIEQADAREEQAQPSWLQHLESYSVGWVSASKPLHIRFEHDVATEDELSRPIPGLVTSGSELELSASFTATNEITVQHSPFTSGSVYAFQLHPGKLQGVPESLGPFNFQVQALVQDYELKISGLVPGDAKNTMVLKGRIKTNDEADVSAVENSLSLEQGGKALPISWSHDSDLLGHEFTIGNIQRSDTAQQLTLVYSATDIGVKKQGTYPVDVPATDQFTITAVRTFQRPEQYIEVSFSEALDRKQNLSGLVRLNGDDVSTRIDGSALRVYPVAQESGTFKLSIEETIKSAKRLLLDKPYNTEVTFLSELPGVRFLSNGSIIPPSPTLTVPIEAINVNAVYVTAFKVYENNVQQYLQNYDVSSHNINNNTGRYLWRKKISLPSVPFDQWQHFDIDLNTLMEKHHDGIINLTLSIDASTIAYNCPKQEKPASENIASRSLDNYEGPGMETYDERPSWFYRYYSQNNGYATYDREKDPCNPRYFTYYRTKNVKSSRNFIVSDLGLMVKQGQQNKYHILATSLTSGKPKANTTIKIYNYQNQKVGQIKTNSLGIAVVEPSSAGYYVIAEHKQDRGYLRLPRNEALPTSQFDTGGVKVQKGLKGFIYGERDVWRPGDNIYLTFMLQDEHKSLPVGHPVSIDFFNPRGVKVATQSNSQPVGNIYPFVLKTEEDAPTGDWHAVVRVGGEYFDKKIKVETIVPNRLKVEITPAQTPIKLNDTPVTTELFAQWLNGATAKSLKADTEIKLAPKTSRFDGYSQYTFDDPASNFQRYSKKVFDSKLSPSGKASFALDLTNINDAPGKLQATFVTRVFEQSGNFSTNIRNFEVLPYQHWAGLNVPKGDGYHNAIARDKDHPVNVVSINSDGQAQAQRQLQISVYRMRWRWWWDQSQENMANYIRRRANNLVSEQLLMTNANGTANFTLKKNTYDWGRHLIRVCDLDSGHCAGQEVYLGWSWSNQVSPDTATQLMLATDKEKYTVGDTATIRVPQLAEGRIFYSLENGSEVLHQQWADIQADGNSFSIPITADMAPNVYLNAVLILPHRERESDAPIRLYGITPLLVDNPRSHLTPELTLPEKVRPQSTFEVTVSEQQQKPMRYTLAVVDEGLLGITGYRTPNPHGSFYKREALGVLTWDMFDGVLGAYGANLERLLKIGGGADGEGGNNKQQRRFPPVVRFLGAHEIGAGESKTHSITLPQYMGAVRVMLVAENGEAYGKAESTVTVTQPLTLLATLPRVLGPKEKVALPINVFVSDASIKEVKVDVVTDRLFTMERNEHSFTFDGPGDQIAMLDMQVADQLGVGSVTVTARAGDESAEQTIHIESRSPNQESARTVNKLLQPGETWTPELAPHGMQNTNHSSVSISSFPPLNLQARMNYLIRYPHGCLEQTTSAIFPQILLKHITELNPKEEQDIQNNVDAAIEKYRRFQQASGAFSYWPGQSYANDWASNYATHFLVEANAMGYAVPNDILDKAIAHLSKVAKGQMQHERYGNLIDAYALYVLSLAGKPELAAMNRLRERLLNNSSEYNNHVARWQLALAYQYLGINDVATELMERFDNKVDDYRFSDYVYGSSLRDEAILLLSYSKTHNDEQAWKHAASIAKQLSSESWYSTQTTAWSLLALAKYAQRHSINSSDAYKFAIQDPANQSNAQWQDISSIATIFSQKVSSQSLADGRLEIRNDSTVPLHAQVTNRGIPSESDEKASSEGLRMTTVFTDMEGNPISPTRLPQGKDFIAVVNVSAELAQSRFKIEDIALTMVMPSGWQIRNQRLEGDALEEGLDYQDIRDDRVLSYFSLWQQYSWWYRYNDYSRTSQKIRVVLNASFAGRFYLPGWQVGPMYEDDIQASTTGQWVEVIAENETAQAKSNQKDAGKAEAHTQSPSVSSVSSTMPAQPAI